MNATLSDLDFILWVQGFRAGRDIQLGLCHRKIHEGRIQADCGGESGEGKEPRPNEMMKPE